MSVVMANAPLEARLASGQMSWEAPVVQPVSSTANSDLAINRLHGRILVLTRAAWVTVYFVTVALFCAAVPVRQRQLLDTLQNLSPAQELVLRELGISVTQHSAFVLAVEILVPLAYFLICLFVFARRADDWVAMVITGTLVTYVVWVSPPLDALATQPEWYIPATVLQSVGMTAAVNFFYLFPDGRQVPRWTRCLTLVSLLWGLAWVFFPSSPFNLSDPYRLPVLSFALLMGWWGVGIGAQLYRFSRVDGPVQRLQTKWVLSAVAIAVAGYLAFGFDRFLVPIFWESHAANVVYDLVGVPLFLLTVLTIPVAFAVSILRHRLWEIDVIINRALVYVALTAILGGLYTASITLSQRLFVALTGEKSDAAIVLTTLVVASAFTQVKSSLQALVDRRVKQAPDPTRSVRELGERVHSLVEVLDVEELTKSVLQQSAHAFGAAGGAVYLGVEGQFRLRHVCGDWTQVEGMSAWLASGNKRHGWIALSPRRNGCEYTEQDRALFAEVAATAARAMRTLERVGLSASTSR